MTAKKRLLPILMAILMVFAMIPMTAGTVYAANGNQAMSVGANVLAQNVNTSNTQTVWYGGKAWRVIGFDGNGAASKIGAATLLAKESLGQTPFDESSSYSNVYADSTLKTKVDAIAGSFSAGEQGAIIKKTLVQGVYNGSDTDCIAGDEDISDVLLWPLSTKEAYAVNNDLRIIDPENTSSAEIWWLRSPGPRDDWVAFVHGDGHAGGGRVSGRYGVRPAFDLNLESVLFISAAESGKSSGAGGADALKAISDNTTNEWKLTLKDASRSDFEASAADGATLVMETGYSDWSIPVVYSGAEAGDNEYVSVLLCDGSGMAKYYGNIAKNSVASAVGGQEVNIPAGLAAGDYTMYVFSEQINGDKLTDYASKFSVINLFVNHAMYFDSNGGTGTMEPVIAGSDGKVTVPKCTFTAPEGKVFWRWNTLPEGTAGNYGTWYDPGDTITLTEDLTLYARWSEPGLSICSYDMTQEKSGSGGKFTDIFGWGDPSYGCNNYTVQLGSEYSVTAISDDGYEFVGWYKGEYIGEDEQGNPIQDAKPYLDDANLITNNLTCSFTVTEDTVICPVFKKTEIEPQPQPATQTITASNVTKTYGNAAFSLGAKTNGDGTLKYKSGNTRVATVSSTGKVTIRGAGTAKITINASATANYKAASKTITVTVNKAANPLKMSAKTATVKYSKLKKKNQTLAVTKVIKFTKKGQGTMTYTKASSNKKITINKKTGKVTVKKGSKKGTYKVKVKVKAAGNANYKASTVKTVTFKVKVK